MGTIFNEFDFDFPDEMESRSQAREAWEMQLAMQGRGPESSDVPTYAISYKSETITPTYFYTLRIWSTAATSAGLPTFILDAIAALGLIEVP